MTRAHLGRLSTLPPTPDIKRNQLVTFFVSKQNVCMCSDSAGIILNEKS